MTWEVASVIIVALIGIIAAVIKFAPSQGAKQQPRANIDYERLAIVTGDAIGKAVSRGVGQVCPSHSGIEEGLSIMRQTLEELKNDVKDDISSIRNDMRELRDMYRDINHMLLSKKETGG